MRRAEGISFLAADHPGHVGGVVRVSDDAEDALVDRPLVRAQQGGERLHLAQGGAADALGVAHRGDVQHHAEAAGAVSPLLKMLFGFVKESSYLSPAPLYHAAPLRFCLSAHMIGGTVVVMEHFDPEEYLRLVERYRLTHSQVVPTMFVRMLKLDAEVRARYDVSSLKCVVHTGGACPVAVKRSMLEWWGLVLYESYGGTESGSLCNSASRNHGNWGGACKFTYKVGLWIRFSGCFKVLP